VSDDATRRSDDATRRSDDATRRSDDARGIMRDFVARTGVERPGAPSVRYLWTDAFAVCNLLGFHLDDGDPEPLRLARRLVDETHRVLGRHREDDPRRGWISGLDEEEGERHPTLGGLRIGKRLPERAPHAPYDPELEWDRDGQYFHYLTRWMHALARMAEVTGEPRYREWGMELARTAWARFLIRDASGQPVGLYWKMSIDLTRPQVPSMGQHDPLDGLIVFSRLQGGADRADDGGLDAEIEGLSRLCAGRSWFTPDVLGLGGLISDAVVLAGLVARSVSGEVRLLGTLLGAARDGLEHVVRSRTLEAPSEHRLAFRELGLSIGLRAAERLRRKVEIQPEPFAAMPGLFAALEAVCAFAPLAPRIEAFWLDPAHRRSPGWRAHLDINEVMLATSLSPRGYVDP
jgi:hypothetical protein